MSILSGRTGKILVFLVLATSIWGMNKACDNFIAKNDDTLFIYKPEIEVIKTLEGSGYMKYIQRLYLNPLKKNELVVIIWPNYWNSLDQSRKKRLLSRIREHWREVYVKTEFYEGLTPRVVFANNLRQ